MARAEKKRAPVSKGSLAAKLRELLVGQEEAIDTIVPYVNVHRAGLSPENRPVGVILMLGPTGTGKTKTVEALAEALHGSARMLLRVDCGEYQRDHEIAKLIGAPPGYIGHTDTTPLLNQQRINAVASENCDISLVLFDEIEKAAESMERLLLGVFDSGLLRVGDNSLVNFGKCLIFCTSNVGAKTIQRANTPDFGFEVALGVDPSRDQSGLHGIGMSAIKRRFSPEFVNRVDSIITYAPLSRESCSRILALMMQSFSQLLHVRLGLRAFRLQYTAAAESLLLDQGTSMEYGARELRRVIQRNVIHPVAEMVTQDQVPPGSYVVIDAKQGEFSIAVSQCAASLAGG